MFLLGATLLSFKHEPFFPSLSIKEEVPRKTALPGILSATLKVFHLQILRAFLKYSIQLRCMILKFIVS
jgi:hypothetical protein